MAMKLTALLFDADGIIAESEDYHRQAFNAAFREFGFPWYWDEAIYRDLLAVGGGKERLRHYITRTQPEMLERSDLYSLIDSMHAAKNLAYADMLEDAGIAWRPGVARLMKEAREAGLRLAIVTATTESNLRALFKATLGLETLSWFEVVVSGDKVPTKKPAPDIYYWVLQEMSLPADACLSIEDSPKGLQACAVARVPAIVTVSAYTTGEDFTGAVAVISDLGEPGKPFKLLMGDAHGHNHVTVELLRLWHAEGQKILGVA